VASLRVTAAVLPSRTQWAFAGLVVIAIGWSAYAMGVLMRRRVLFGRQRVAASRMALLFTLVAFGGSLAVRDRIGMGGIITSAGLVLIAAVLLVAARRHVSRLSALVRDMEHQK